MDIVQLYQDFGIEIAPEGHHHTRPGWINVECPFCSGNPGYHLGYELEGNYYTCWRCGWHPIVPTLSNLLHMSGDQVSTLIKDYGLNALTLPKPKLQKAGLKPYRLPSGTFPLESYHKKYLESRNFDPDLIQRLWAVVGTGPVSLLDGLSYKLRIIAPVVWDSRAVSFVSRDITNKHPRKYLVCPKEREIVFHKNILYGKQEAWKDTGICVEGPTDVWRFGGNSFATFGIKYTNNQIRCMAKTFKRIAIVFDDDAQAVVQAKTLVNELRVRNVDAFHVPIKGDPGSMEQNEANYLVKQLIS